MRVRKLAVAGVTALAVAGAGVGTAVASSSATTKVTCKESSYQVSSKTGTTSKKATLLGTISCGKALGKGVEQSAQTTTLAGNAFTGKGTSKEYFNTGTVSGTYKVTGTTTSSKFTGTEKLTGGTGSYKGIKGTAKLSCSEAATSSQATCTVVSKITKL